MTPQQIADAINWARAERGDPPINARVELGCIVSDQSVRRVTASAPHKPRQANGGQARRRRIVDGSRTSLVLDALAASPDGLAVKDIANRTGLKLEHVGASIAYLEKTGRCCFRIEVRTIKTLRASDYTREIRIWSLCEGAQ